MFSIPPKLCSSSLWKTLLLKALRTATLKAEGRSTSVRGIWGHPEGERQNRLWRFRRALLFCLLLPTILLQDTRPGRIETTWQYTLNLYHHGYLRRAQEEAASGYAVFQYADTNQAARFRILQAEITLWRGYFHEALQLLSTLPEVTPKERVHALSVAAQALAYQHELPLAMQHLQQARQLCYKQSWPECGYLLKTAGSVALMRGESALGEELTQQALTFSRRTGDRYLEGRVLVNLGWIADRSGHAEEARNLNGQALAFSLASGDQDSRLIALGNLISGSYNFGDTERNRAILQESIRHAEELGDPRTELMLLNILSEADLTSWRLQEAEEDSRRLLVLARTFNDHPRIAEGLRDFVDVLLWQGKAEEAEKSLREYRSLISVSDTDSADWSSIRQAQILALQGRGRETIAMLRPLIAREQNSQHYLNAAMWLARALLSTGHSDEAESTYRQALVHMEGELRHNPSFTFQMLLKNEASILLSDYIRLLAREGRGEEALLVVDRCFSASENHLWHSAPVNPRTVAQKAHATILIWWLGHESSYLWAVTPQAVHTVELPSEHVLRPQIRAWCKAVATDRENDPGMRAQGEALWRTLVAPATPWLPHNGQIVLIDDEELSRKNIETLPVPGGSAFPSTAADRNSHYWIEDVTLRMAPSLSALSAAHTSSVANNRLLMLGDALQASPIYEPLPLAGLEMSMVRKHFAATQSTVLQREAATPLAYATSNPGHYAWLHFVAHAAPGSADPRDDMIVLSRSGPEENSWRLTAREILTHPLHARLVTISACSGSGSRYFTGEGMVGLGWAFQQAGAENVIGTLWDVSDESTPQLMDKLYTALRQGLSPAAALHQAKLAMLHGTLRYRAPFYWGPFEIYTQK